MGESLVSFFQSIVESWWSWSAALFVQTTLLIAGLALLEQLGLDRLRPPVRLTLWSLVALKFLISPEWSSELSVRNLVDEADPMVPDLVSGSGLESSLEFATESAPLPGATAGLFCLWLVGGALLMIRSWRRARTEFRNWRASGIDAGATHLDELVRNSALELRLPRRPEVRLSAEATTAFVVAGGRRRRLVVLPERLLAAPLPRVRHILLHELTHLRRRDLLRQQLFSLLRVCYWYHPLLPVVGKKLERLRELCCDLDVARRIGSEVESYRRTLLVEASHSAGLRLSHAAPLLTSRGALLERLEQLRLRSAPSLRTTRALQVLVALFAIGSLLPLGAEAAVPSRARPIFESTRIPRPSVAVRSRPEEHRRLEAQVEAARDQIEKLNRGDAGGCLRMRYAAALIVSYEQDRASGSKSSQNSKEMEHE